MAKKYYWLKLREDFFRLKEIKKLRKIAGGDTYTIIYLKLQLLSIKNEGRIIFDQVEDDFADELALELDEEIENVRMTLLFLQKHNLLEFTEIDGEYLLPAVLSCIGKESESAERVRKHREKLKEKELKALQCNTAVTTCNTEIEIDIEIEQQQELEQESEKNAEKQKELEQQEDVVAVFAKHGINIQAVLKKLPDIRDVDWEIVASTLATKKAAGKIANPVGLLMTDPTGIIDDILAGRLYPDSPKRNKTPPREEAEIYISPATLERLQAEAP